MAKTKFSTVEEYITHSDPDARPIMNQLREIITSTIPEVEEKISWGVPFYRHHGPLGGFAVYQQHISFGAAADLPAPDNTAGFDTMRFVSKRDIVETYFSDRSGDLEPAGGEDILVIGT